MSTEQSQRFFSKTLSIAIATASVLISVPTFAGSHPAATSKPATSVTQATSAGTIVDVASANSSFKTLVTALKAADLVETLSGNGPFTVFAPTDAAFASLPKGTLEKLLKPENKVTLQKILTYHVVPGSIDSKTIKSGQVKTVQGSPVNVKVNRGSVMVDKAKVTKADIKATNGVIHVIDKVILPAGLKL
ncbi:fasciclin domain-containing protein [Mastigocladopsis repens]|uniref:fasciclin domain-containing protein n=1 Tax=Mastigocladopsis repens TaxID=221287 RepID=UPI000313C39A|nr:fasciclin domain-containing protein [Mastigocladopsis repens]